MRRYLLTPLLLLGFSSPNLAQSELPSELCIKGNIIAVIDTGADVAHPMFAKELWKNPGETGVDALGNDKATNQIDDDNNGYIDDVHGWNFVNDNPNLYDYSGHGTHIAGLIRQQSEGAALALMVLKYYDPRYDDRPSQKEFISALKYALKMGADVINISGGGYQPHSEEWRLMKEAHEKGVTVIAASGNTKANSELPTKLPFFPAAYALANVVSVVATNSSGDILPTSNIPPRKTNILMPGNQLSSALPDGKFGFMTGSSQAAASYTGKLVAHKAAGCQAGDTLSKRKNQSP